MVNSTHSIKKIIDCDIHDHRTKLHQKSASPLGNGSQMLHPNIQIIQFYSLNSTTSSTLLHPMKQHEIVIK